MNTPEPTRDELLARLDQIAGELANNSTLQFLAAPEISALHAERTKIRDELYQLSQQEEHAR